MADVVLVAASAAGGIGTVAGYLVRHLLNGKISKNGTSHETNDAAEFRGEMRQIMLQQAKTMDKIVDLMGDVHQEIAHTNEVLTQLAGGPNGHSR